MSRSKQRAATRRLEAASCPSPLELLSRIGLSLTFCWLLLCTFGFGTRCPNDLPLELLDVQQLPFFIGLAAGCAAQGTAKAGRFCGCSVRGRVLALASALSCSMPVASTVMGMGFAIALPVAGALGFLSGVGGSFLLIAWFATCSKVPCEKHGKMTGVSLCCGALLFALVMVSSAPARGLSGIACICASTYMLAFIAVHVQETENRTGTRGILSPRSHVRGMELVILLFNLSFSLSFFYLINQGRWAIASSALPIALGALLVTLLSMRRCQPSFITILRLCTCITVLICIVMPFVEGAARVVCCDISLGTWACCAVAGHGFSMELRDDSHGTSAWRHTVRHFLMETCGLAAGWAVNTAMIFFVGPDGYAFTYVRLATAVALVIAIMTSYPIEEKRPVENVRAADNPQETVPQTADELFERRIEAAAKLYGLSPREADVLRLLARGHKAGSVQKHLQISLHTAKSHIYNIYKKLDTHSQQEVIDLIENMEGNGQA